MTLVVANVDGARFHQEGYVVVRNAVPAALLNEIGTTVVRVFAKFNPQAGVFGSSPIDDPGFHEALIRFRAEQPRQFGLFFDTVQTSVALWRFGTDSALVATAAALMDDAPTGVSVTDMLLRMDTPGDVRNKLQWHQDSSYFRQNSLGSNGCVCSVALKDVGSDEGPLEVLPGSHRLGRIEVASSGRHDTITSEQYLIPDGITNATPPVSIPLRAGDALFLNFDLIHRSGTNRSASIRFTAISRFHRMLTDDFTAGRLVYRPSNAG